MGETEWDFGWQQYENSNVATEKRDLLGALSCTKEVWLLNRFLNWSLTEGSGIRKADGRSVISRVAMKNVLSRRNTRFSLNEIKRFADENEATLSSAQRE